MTLTPTLKFIIIATAVVIALASEIWTDLEVDLGDIGLDGPVFNIVDKVLNKLDLAASGLLVYLGIKAPTIGEEVREIDQP